MIDNYDVNRVEDLMFWFLKSQKIKKQMIRSTKKSEKKFTVDDIFIIINRLYLQGKIKKEHLVVLKKIQKDNGFFSNTNSTVELDELLWNEFLQILYPYFSDKGMLN